MSELSLHTLVINSLEEQIAVIDRNGTILDVNAAWISFGIENGISADYSCLGSNYLAVLAGSAAGGDELAAEAAQGVSELLDGNRSSFYFEYPCHSPDRQRWFMLRGVRLKDDSRSLFVVSHHNITERKLAEERAEHLALHDPLTGLANRRGFRQFMHREMRRSIRNQSPISLIAVDLDYFKEYNDELGHTAGDRCLVRVGEVLLAQCRRPDDLAVRMGGDEFALVLGGTDMAGAQVVANAIPIAVHKLGLVYGGPRVVSVSVGVASMIPDDPLNEDLLVQEADQALYRAKLEGRNRAAHLPLDAS